LRKEAINKRKPPNYREKSNATKTSVENARRSTNSAFGKAPGCNHTTHNKQLNGIDRRLRHEAANWSKL
jgi:hypothetical protein